MKKPRVITCEQSHDSCVTVPASGALRSAPLFTAVVFVDTPSIEKIPSASTVPGFVAQERQILYPVWIHQSVALGSASGLYA